MNTTSAKLSSNEKTVFKNMKTYFKETKTPVSFFQTDNVTLAVCRHAGSGKFKRVAVSYRSPLDGFSKKRGKFEALKRLDDGVFLLVPADFSMDAMLDELDYHYPV